MDLISSNTIEVTSLALSGLAARHKAIASNIANAETPGYKRVDVEFEDQLQKIMNTNEFKEAQKVANSNQVFPSQPLNVNHNQAMMDIKDFNPETTESDLNDANSIGNTVDIEQEMAKLAKNGMTYDALAVIQAKKFRSLEEVMRS